MVNIGVISKKWSNDVLLALKDGSKRFNQLMKIVSDTNNKISTRTLADRLKNLEEEGLVSREIIQGRPPATTYNLTKKGKQAIDILLKLSQL